MVNFFLKKNAVSLTARPRHMKLFPEENISSKRRLYYLVDLVSNNHANNFFAGAICVELIEPSLEVIK